MPVIDMPLSELKQYQGKNPCPEDFDEYWKKALGQMAATDPNVDIRPADFSCGFADCYDMYFSGVNNARIYAKLITPKTKKNSPAILSFHGYSAASSEWTQYLPYAAQGFVVAAMDCRGQGGRSQDNTQTFGTTFHGHIIRGLDDKPENLAFRQIYLDTAMLAKVVTEMDYVDPNNIMAMGGSQGGALTLACASLVPQIKKAAPVFPFLCDFQRVWELDLCTGAYIELRDYFRKFDPTHKREKQIFTRLGYIDIQHLAKWIKADVLIAVALRDDICPPSTQFAAYNKMTCKKQMIIYPDFNHETLPGFADKTFQWLTADD
jgi:cephalosporin-C deacetylase